MRKIVPVFNTPLKVKENDPARRELENLVTEGINSTTKESRFIVEDVEEFENGVGKRTSPLKDVSNQLQVPVVARKSQPVSQSASQMLSMIAPWADKESGVPKSSKPKGGGKRKRKQILESGDTQDSQPEDNPTSGAGWRRNYALLSVLKQIVKAMEDEKLSFSNLKFSTMVFSPLIEDGTITVDSTMTSRKHADKSNDLKSRIQTILTKFKKTYNLPPNVCPDSDHKEIEQTLVAITELDTEYDGNPRCNVKKFKESKSGNYFGFY